ncbi:MAG: phage Gp37/Gp68 family protein [Defluviitaleaceae bacterium]|nr:phage Gp37/Gp68 family protein [Defluviitaleaceae bacterium]
MSTKSRIEWTESTWNPITGCDKFSAGCENCYAFRMAQRLKHMGNPKYTNGFELTLHEDCLGDPTSWKKPMLIFVNSMSDLLHKDVPLEYIQKIFRVMNDCPHHIFQLLTKRAERLQEIANEVTWSENIWLGVTVENEACKKRIQYLKDMPAKIKFISFEPLLDDVGVLDLQGIDWAIIGGESGPKSRPMQEDWVINIKHQCEKQGVLFYFKQWGGTNKKKTGRTLLGRTWDDMPEIFYAK